MSQAEILGVAAAGDTISGDDLQASIDALEAVAAGLDEQLGSAPDTATLQSLTQTQIDLRSRAMALVNRQIDLLAGKARVSADQVNAAAEAARKAIERIADIRKRLQTIGKLLDFFAVVLTGDGGAIVEAAFALKEGIDAAG